MSAEACVTVSDLRWCIAVPAAPEWPGLGAGSTCRSRAAGPGPVARAPRHPSGGGSALHLRARPRRGRRLGPRGSVCRPSGIRVDRDGGAQAGSGASRGSHARPAGRCSPTGTASPGANCGRLSGTHARAVRAQRAVIASLGWEIVCKAQGRASCALSADFLGIPLYLSVTDKSV